MRDIIISIATVLAFSLIGCSAGSSTSVIPGSQNGSAPAFATTQTVSITPDVNPNPTQITVSVNATGNTATVAKYMWGAVGAVATGTYFAGATPLSGSFAPGGNVILPIQPANPALGIGCSYDSHGNPTGPTLLISVYAVDANGNTVSQSSTAPFSC